MNQQGQGTNEAQPHIRCATMPWDVPRQTVIIEYAEGRWRVVSRARPVAYFRHREDALRHAHAIAALFTPPFTIVERDAEPSADALAS